MIYFFEVSGWSHNQPVTFKLLWRFILGHSYLSCLGGWCRFHSIVLMKSWLLLSLMVFCILYCRYHKFYLIYCRWLENEKNALGLKGQTSMDRYTKRDKFTISSVEMKELIRSVALNLIVDCDMPISVVERPGFLRHLEVVNSKYRPIQRWVRSMFDWLP